MNFIRSRFTGMFVVAVLCFPVLSQGQIRRINLPELDRIIQQKESQIPEEETKVRQQFADAFEYPAIIQAVYRLHGFYEAHPVIDANDRAYEKAVAQHMERVHQQYRDTIIPAFEFENPGLEYSLTHLKSNVLIDTAEDNLTPEKILDYIDPVKRRLQNRWIDSKYAALALTYTLGSTTESYPGLESYLRHAQIRILYRLSVAAAQSPNSRAGTDIVQAVGQLRVALMTLHTTYKRLYGKDPLVGFKWAYSYPRQLKQVVVTPRGPVEQDAAQPETWENVSDPNAPDVYEHQRQSFLQEMRYWKAQLPQDKYSFTKLVEVLKNRNHTANFDAGEAVGDVIVNDVLFFIPMINSLIELAGGGSNRNTTPTANLTALAPAAVEYNLLMGRVEDVAQIVDLLEPEKLAEKPYEAIFKNGDLYQHMQPVVAEVFNTLYVYTITPGRSPAEQARVMQLLVNFSNPQKYSIMTRLAAIATAAKLVDMRYRAQNPIFASKPGAEPLDEGTLSAVKEMGLPNSFPHPGTPDLTLPVVLQAQDGTFYQGQRSVHSYSYMDLMAQRIANIYAALLKGHLPGTEDYGLGATQTKLLEDRLAVLYNIFQREVEDPQKYPQIYPPSQARLEQRMGYNRSGFREKQLYTFGARVHLTEGGTVDMNLDNPVQSHFEKNAGEFLSNFAVDVVSWKFLVSTWRAGKYGVHALKGLSGQNLVLNTTRALVPAEYFTSGTSEAMAKMIRVENTLANGVDHTLPEVKQGIEKLDYVLTHPVPDVLTRAEALAFLGLPENASEVAFKRALRNMRLRYHPDRIIRKDFITDEAYEALTANMQRLNNFEKYQSVADAAATEAAIKATRRAERQAQEMARQAEQNAWNQATMHEKAAMAAEEAAAKVPLKPRDFQSWGNITRGFAGFFTWDYLLSYLNVPLEKKMQQQALAKAQNAYTAPKFDNHQKPTPSLADGSPLEFLDQVAQAADPQRQGALFALPINTWRYYHGSDVLGDNFRAISQNQMHRQSFQNAFVSGNVKKFQSQIEQALLAADAELNETMQQFDECFKLSSQASRELKQAYNIYKQFLKQASQLAETDLTGAYKLVEEMRNKQSHTRADIIIRALKVYWPHQTAQMMTQELDVLRQHLGEQGISVQEETEIQHIFETYGTQKQALLIREVELEAESFEMPQELYQAQIQALLAQNTQLENQLTERLDRLSLRLMLKDQLETFEQDQQNFFAQNEFLMQTVPTVQKEIKQNYRIYYQYLKQAQFLLEPDLKQAKAVYQESTEKFANTRAKIMIYCTKQYWQQQLAPMQESFTQAVEEAAEAALTDEQRARIQQIVQDYVEQKEALSVKMWQTGMYPLAENWQQTQAKLPIELEVLDWLFEQQINELFQEIQPQESQEP